MSTQDTLGTNEHLAQPEPYSERMSELDKAFFAILDTPDNVRLNARLEEIEKEFKASSGITTSEVPNEPVNYEKPMTQEQSLAAAKMYAKSKDEYHD